MSGRLPRDTPLDTPIVPSSGPLIEAAELGPDAVVIGARALARARSVETLEVAYEAWLELREAHAAAQRRWREERERLRQQGTLLLGAVKAAGATPEGSEAALAPAHPLAGFLAEAKGKLATAERDFEQRAREANEAYLGQLDQLRGELLSRVERQAAVMRPVFRLAVRTLPGERRILHAHRLGADESVVALFALTRRIPSRYDFLFDDSTDDVQAAPPVLYPDEGVTSVRPSAPELIATLAAARDVWPVKGMLALPLGAGWVRWISRGAVLEAEVLDHQAFRNVLTAAEAEQVTGLLLAHKLAGRIELELVRD